jgi:hypothetical protein
VQRFGLYGTGTATFVYKERTLSAPCCGPPGVHGSSAGTAISEHTFGDCSGTDMFQHSGTSCDLRVAADWSAPN